MADLLSHPDLWEYVAKWISDDRRQRSFLTEYDLADSSEAMDVVQLVCEELNRQGYELRHQGDHALGWNSTLFVKDADGTIRKVVYE